MMEYMLLADGTVKTFDNLPGYQQVIEALQDYMGIGYYWQLQELGWCLLTPVSNSVSDNRIADEDVPDVIKLAAMLE